MAKDTFYQLGLEEGAKLIIPFSTKDEIYLKLFSVYEKFISSELPKISTDIEQEGEIGNSLVRAVVDGVINTISSYPHPEKDRILHIEVKGTEESVGKIKNILETSLIMEGE